MSSQAETIQYLVDNLTKYPDFPKPGIIFRLVFLILILLFLPRIQMFEQK